MSIQMTDDVARSAAFGRGGMLTRERFMFGPCVFIAPVQAAVQGTSVSAVAQLDDTSAKHDPAAGKNGTVSGLRPWRRDSVY